MGEPAIPARPPADFADLIERDRDELLQLLAELGSVDWSASTRCPGWSVLDLAVHLLGVDLGVLARDRDEHLGTPPPATIRSEGEFVAFIDDLNETWVEGGRRLSPRLVMDLLEWAGAQLVALYRSQDPTALTGRVSWASDGSVPKWLDQGRELTERWIHHQQIREGAGRPPRLEATMTGMVLDVLSWAYPYRLSALSRPPGTTVRVRVTGTVERDWHFIAQPGGWSRAASPGEEVLVELVMDTDIAWRLLSNNLEPGAFPEPKSTTDAELVRVLSDTRAIIGVPNP